MTKTLAVFYKCISSFNFFCVLYAYLVLFFLFSFPPPLSQSMLPVCAAFFQQTSVSELWLRGVSAEPKVVLLSDGSASPYGIKKGGWKY